MSSTRYMLMLLTPVVLQLIGLCFAVWNDPYIHRKHRRSMLIIIALIVCLIVQNLAGYHLDRVGMPRERTLVAILGYSIRPFILLMFFSVISEKKRNWISYALIGINAAVHLTALFSGFCFSIDASNTFHRGPLGYTCHIVSALLLFQLVYLSVHKYAEGEKRKIWIPVFNALLIISSVVMDAFVDYRKYPLSFLTIAIVSASVFYYVWLHLQLVREHEREMMAEQRVQIMMSQIQPHFLYNTLATIKALCRKDPELAASITEKFSVYLRQNLNSLSQKERILFSSELEHTKTYADIEMVRFNTIRVEYDIQDNGFFIPPLTLQPLVENAIRHGVRSREKGLVQIIARRTENSHEIVVQDNGEGFDVQKIGEMDSSHIGIRNVRERLEQVCGGTLTIESTIGEGTRAIICIPADT